MVNRASPEIHELSYTRGGRKEKGVGYSIPLRIVGCAICTLHITKSETRGLFILQCRHRSNNILRLTLQNDKMEAAD